MQTGTLRVGKPQAAGIWIEGDGNGIAAGSPRCSAWLDGEHVLVLLRQMFFQRATGRATR